MNREQFFQELRTALHREGFTPQPEQDELLPVGWDGLPLCRITADGGVRYWQEDPHGNDHLAPSHPQPPDALEPGCH